MRKSLLPELAPPVVPVLQLAAAPVLGEGMGNCREGQAHNKFSGTWQLLDVITNDALAIVAQHLQDPSPQIQAAPTPPPPCFPNTLTALLKF